MYGFKKEAADDALTLGRRIRKLREERRFSLRSLAEACDLSVNAISMIERGESSPRASSLHLLARALGVRITDFFEDEGRKRVVYVNALERESTLGDSGVIEMLGSGLVNQQMEPILLTLEAGASEKEIAHPGQEFALCLDGAVEYTVSGETYLLHQGDSLLFDSGEPHSIKNPGFRRGKLLLVFSSCEGTGLAKERHLGQ